MKSEVSRGQERYSVVLTLQGVHGLNLLLDCGILIGKFLCLCDHALYIFGAKTTLIVGDCDGFGLSGTLVEGGHFEDTVG